MIEISSTQEAIEYLQSDQHERAVFPASTNILIDDNLLTPEDISMLEEAADMAGRLLHRL